jgi:hypothetical protein
LFVEGQLLELLRGLLRHVTLVEVNRVSDSPEEGGAFGVEAIHETIHLVVAREDVKDVGMVGMVRDVRSEGLVEGLEDDSLEGHLDGRELVHVGYAVLEFGIKHLILNGHVY